MEILKAIRGRVWGCRFISYIGYLSERQVSRQTRGPCCNDRASVLLSEVPGVTSMLGGSPLVFNVLSEVVLRTGTNSFS